MKTNIIGIVAAVGVGLLALNIPGINIHHHLELPVLDKDRVVVSTQFTFTGIVSTKTDIRLEQEVWTPSLYKHISRVLDEAKTGDKIVFHLSGFGGREDTMFQLLNNIKSSKANVVMEVEAPVYSAYAYLAANGPTLIMKPYTFLMFHFSSILAADCSKEVGLDRGISKQFKCEQFKAVDIALGTRMLNNTPILTQAEKQQILNGGDVYLTSEVVNARQGGQNDSP